MLWLLRDFSLKLEDKNGNTITEKQYLESALTPIKGATDSIEEKNRVRNLIRTYFPERDCYVMVRPVEKESDLQNMQNLPDSFLRKEFLQQAQLFRTKVIKKTKPKIFMKKTLNGAMLIDLIQSVLDSINEGSIPVIENSWKYVIESECIKYTDKNVRKFIEEIHKYREENKDKNDFVNNVRKYTKNLLEEYIKKFLEGGFAEDETKDKFIKKFREKLNNELEKFDKENMKIFEEKFNKDIEELSKNFISTFDNNDKYNNNYYQFFTDLEDFREQAEKLSPEFPHKNEILFDKVMIIIRKFIETQLIKNRLESEKQIINYKNAIDQLKERLQESNNEILQLKQNNGETISKLNSDVINEKMKHKLYEDKINALENEKNRIRELSKKEEENLKSDYEHKLKEMLNSKSKNENELKAKEEQLLVLKMNNEKMNSLHEQKIDYLQKEIQNWKDKFSSFSKESSNKEQNLRDELNSLKIQNENLKSEQKKSELSSNEQMNQNMTNLLNYFKDNLRAQKEENKNMFQQILLQQKEKEKNEQNEKELFKNFKQTTEKVQELTLSLNSSENKVKMLEEQINKLNLYKEIIHNSKGFKCKFCMKIFPFDGFREHFIQCQKDMLNNNNNLKTEFSSEKLKLKIIKGKLKTDEVGKPYLEYIMDISYNGLSWRINKRFNQFANLHKTLKNLFKGVINMPQSANIFTNINDMNLSGGSFHENKIQQLEKFIKDLSEIEQISNSKPFYKFLKLNHAFDDDSEMFINTQVNNFGYDNRINNTFNNDYEDNVIENNSILKTEISRNQE
jgi:DNA repair exonuclease SbcCD ATPase subunit